MKKTNAILMTLIMLVTFFAGRVLAADVEVDKTGWTKVGENEVQIGKLPIESAEFTADGNFSRRQMRLYTNEEYTNGTFDNERNSEITYGGIGTESHLIVYNGSLSYGAHDNLGSFSLKWTKGAKLQDGTECDVKLNIVVLTLVNAEESNTTKPILILDNTAQKYLRVDSKVAQQERTGAYLAEHNYDPSLHGATKLDITFEITKTGTSERIENKKMVFKFDDIDQPDTTVWPWAFCSDGTVNSNGSRRLCPDDTYGTPSTYVEGVTLVSGVVDKLYMDNNTSWLNISNTSYGANTRLTGKKSANNESESDKAGFTTRFNSSNIHYIWTGSSCATGIGYMPTKTVETSTSGEYPNNVHITETDNEVFWKEDKEIEITPDPGYSLSKVTVDGKTIDISTLTKKNGKYYYTFNDVISNHTIDVQVTREPYTLLVHHYKEGTTEKLGNDVTETKYYGDSYTTSPLASIPEGYELVGTPGNASGTIQDNVTVIYYYKLKNYNLTVHHYEEGTTNSLAPDEVSTKKYGDEYSTTASSSVPNIYEYVSRTDNHEGTIKKNEVVNYYYKKKKGVVNVHHYIEGTTTKLANDETYTKNYGDIYETSASKSIPLNYVLKTTPTNYRGEVNKPTTEVIYYYQKKDSKIVPEISKSGTERISSSNDKVSYKIIYKDTFTDLIGNGTVTIVDTLPYKIDVNNSNLDGGTYNDSNKTITWTENISINSYNEASKTFEKNIELKYIGINASSDVLVNKVKGTITADNKTIDVDESFNTIIDIKGDITERYLDKETGEPIIPNVKTTDKVGREFTPDEKEFEGYVLVTKPEDKDYKYEENPQTLTYEYEKIKLNVITKVIGTGGTIEGDEVVLYGDDSTKDKIKIQADNGYVISKILINGEELGIPENTESMILSNFIKMTEDKLVEVSFEPKPVVVKAPKTDSNKPLFVVITGVLFVGIALIFYLYKTGKLSSLLKKNK